MTVQEKITCPFIKVLYKTQKLGIGPKTYISKLKNFGNANGGSLGDILEFFANLNHYSIDGMFDLNFLDHGSGQHLGSSLILHDGKFNEKAWKNFIDYSVSNEYITIENLSRFIYSNLKRDNVLQLPSILDFAKVAKAFLIGDAKESLKNFFRNFPIVVCCGEWALVYALFERDKYCVKLDCLEALFVDRVIAKSAENYPKSKYYWMKMTIILFINVRKIIKKVK